MTGENDPDYYATRERQARELATSAIDPQVKAIHLEMADRYARLQDEAARDRRRSNGTAQGAP